tara:strand:+ start:427 stop:1563 length:1137 start_codon:yes stop_codon:yes gene_type:complete
MKNLEIDHKLPTPCYLIDEHLLEDNIKKIKRLKTKTNCKVILALKGFATFNTFYLMKNVIDGITASSIYEMRLGYEEFNREIHIHSIAMNQNEFNIYNKVANSISFNSLNQLRLFRSKVKNIKATIGLRINPEVSTVKTKKYDPCGKYSRLGVPISQMNKKTLEQIDGIHFHALCEQNTPSLFKCMDKIENKFGSALEKLSWINIGGGHLITDENYKLDELIHKINEWQKKYKLKIILEPGEAIGRHCGFYISKVLDIINNEKNIIICDISATAHMPDVLEYPYRPTIKNSGNPNQYKYNYIIGGNTCLAGDIIGEYSFKKECKINDILIFNDMGHYTIVKTSNFNGVKQPSIGMINKSGKIKLLKFSSYFNFKERLS